MALFCKRPRIRPASNIYQWDRFILGTWLKLAVSRKFDSKSEALSDELSSSSKMDPQDRATLSHSLASPVLHGRPVRWVELEGPRFRLMVLVELLQQQQRLLHPGLEVSGEPRALPRALHT